MAEVSGPGQFSKRTDKAVSEANRSLPNAGYGEQAAYQEQVGGAALPTAPSAPAPDVTGMSFDALFGSAASRVTPLDAPTARPDEPVTAGVDYGPGPGSEALGLRQEGALSERTRAAMPYLIWMANRPGSSDAARMIVRQLKSQM